MFSRAYETFSPIWSSYIIYTRGVGSAMDLDISQSLLRGAGPRDFFQRTKVTQTYIITGRVLHTYRRSLFCVSVVLFDVNLAPDFLPGTI